MQKTAEAVQRNKTARRPFVGLGGSPLATTHKVQTQERPKNQQGQFVRVHFCFDQERGELRAPRCNCKMTVSRRRAYELVDARQADFLLVKNPKTEELTKFHRAIVIRRMYAAGETLFAVAPPVKVDPRDRKYEQIKNGIRVKARGILHLMFGAKLISPKQMQMSDAEIDATLSEPSKLDAFLAELTGQRRFQKKWSAVALEWWSNLLGYHRLSPDAGAFLVDADRGVGQLVTGGYDLTKIGQVDGARQTDTGRVAVANHRASYWNGAWDYSRGASPDVDESDSDRAMRIESAHAGFSSQD